MGISCNTQMRLAIQHCHGWALPYHTATRTDDFDAEGQLQNPKVSDRLQRMARDLVVYGQLLQAQFDADRLAAKELNGSSAAGFAAALATGFAAGFAAAFAFAALAALPAFAEAISSALNQWSSA